MKKRILLLSVLMTLGVLTCISSCGKDGSYTTTGNCVCEIYYNGNYEYTEPGFSATSSECSGFSTDMGQGYMRKCHLE